MENNKIYTEFKNEMVNNAVIFAKANNVTVSSLIHETLFGKKLKVAKKWNVWNKAITEVLSEHPEFIEPGKENGLHDFLAGILLKTVMEGHCTMKYVNNIEFLKKGLRGAWAAAMVVEFNNYANTL